MIETAATGRGSSGSNWDGERKQARLMFNAAATGYKALRWDRTERPQPPSSAEATARKAATLSWSLSSKAGSALVLTMITPRVGSM